MKTAYEYENEEFGNIPSVEEMAEAQLAQSSSKEVSKVTITKKEYEKLLDFKFRYESVSK